MMTTASLCQRKQQRRLQVAAAHEFRSLAVSLLKPYFCFAVELTLYFSAIAAAQAEWDKVREEKIRGGGGVGGKQDDDEGSGQFVSFVPLPTQAEIESAILAKRKAELLQVR